MHELYKPTIYAKNIYSINYTALKKQKIKYLFFDIDNTIADSKGKEPDDKVIQLFENLKKEGFSIILLTNALPHRALKFARKLKVKAYYLACKPTSINYKRIRKALNLNHTEIAAIGDQLLTDIKGANKQKITSILVDKISNNESIITKLNRKRENKLIQKYNLLKRGEYYE